MVFRLLSISGSSVLFCIAILLQYCGASQHRDGSVDWQEFKKEVLSGDINFVDQSKEGKTVHLSGKVLPIEYVKDTTIGVSYKGISLLRSAQIFQWIETTGFTEGRKGSTSGKGGVRKGGSGSKIIDIYQKVWVEQPIDHTNFNKPEGHENKINVQFHPDHHHQAGFYKLGSFEVSGNLFSEYVTDVLPLDKNLTQLDLSYGFSAEYEETGLVVYSSTTAKENPQIGDTRYIYRTLTDTFSLIGTQLGNRIYGGADKESLGRSLCRAGLYTADELIDKNAGALVEGSYTLGYFSIFFVFLSMLMINDLLKSKLGEAPVWKHVLNLPLMISAAINACWTFGILFTICSAYNDFEQVVFAVPIIFLAFLIFFVLNIIIAKKGSSAVDFRNNT